MQGNEGATVVGQTNTTARHEDLKAAGIVPVVKDGPHNTEKFPYVIFCAPPSGSSDYAAEVRLAISPPPAAAKSVFGSWDL